MKTNDVIRTYSHAISLSTFKERFEYLKLDGSVCQETFGGYRELNQRFYSSYEWKRFKDKILVRDNFCDLAHPDFEIAGAIYVHHLNPLLPEDLLYRTEKCFDEENVISVSFKTHQYITYGLPFDSLYQEPVQRERDDTILWARSSK